MKGSLYYFQGDTDEKRFCSRTDLPRYRSNSNVAEILYGYYQKLIQENNLIFNVSYSHVEGKDCFCLLLKAPSEIATDDTFIFFYFYLLKKIRLDVSCES